ncbi:MAG: hypothetical protein V1913_02515 [Fibrobacterota bacterium]
MRFTYNLGKNIKLKLERGIGFEALMEQVEKGNYQVARVMSRTHKGQACFIFRHNKKTWIAPFTEYKTRIHLYTVFQRD